VYRPEENALLVWNSELARTAYIGGEDLEELERWVHSGSSGYIDRLKSLGLVSDADKDAVAAAITKSRIIQAPTCSFAAPESLHIELTEYCPLNCLQCYKGSSGNSSLDIGFLISVIQQAKEMQVFQIALGGGEPLLYPDLQRVVSEIHQSNMAVSITSSGYGLDSQTLDELIACGLNHIQISLNGSCEEIDSKSRSSYNYAIAALGLLQNQKASFGINWVARRDNVYDFLDFVRVAKSYKVDNINILRYKPTEHERYEDNSLNAEEIAFLAQAIKHTNGIPIKVDSAFSNLRCHLSQQVSLMSGCGAGRRFLAISADGYYRPCSHVEIKESATNLRQVWYGSKNLEMFRVIDSKVGEPCAKCEYLPGCHGCRAITLGQGNDFFAGHEDCPYTTYLKEL
jgi:pyrroloquinoline quinone biosynthesis protein E